MGTAGGGTALKMEASTATDVRRLPGLDRPGRNETALERCDRNLVELLQEVRVVQTGVQVLFGFLLTAPLAARFPDLSQFQRLTYFATLLAAGGAAGLFVPPPAVPPGLFRVRGQGGPPGLAPP